MNCTQSSTSSRSDPPRNKCEDPSKIDWYDIRIEQGSRSSRLLPSRFLVPVEVSENEHTDEQEGGSKAVPVHGLRDQNRRNHSPNSTNCSEKQKEIGSAHTRPPLFRPDTPLRLLALGIWIQTPEAMQANAITPGIPIPAIRVHVDPITQKSPPGTRPISNTSPPTPYSTSACLAAIAIRCSGLVPGWLNRISNCPLSTISPWG